MIIRQIVIVLILCVSMLGAGCSRNLGASTKAAVNPEAASNPSHRNELLRRASGLLDAARVGAKAIVAVGKQGEIFRSDDGHAWRNVESKISQALLSVAFSDGKHGAIVGVGGTYLESADTGASWTARSIGTHEDLFTVRFFEHGKGFILGAFGTLLQTDDSGKAWRAIDLNWTQLLPELSQQIGLVQPHLYGVAFSDSQHGWIVGEYGLIIATDDGGKSWHWQAGGGMADRQLFTIASVAPGSAVAAGQGGEILSTSGYSNHWVTSLPPNGFDIYALVPLRSNAQMLALGDLGSAYLSNDAGRPDSWHSISLARGNAAGLAGTWLAAALSGPDDFILAFGQLGIWRLALDSADNPAG